MKEPINGFTLRAADNSGKCYATKKVTKAMAGGDIVKALSDDSINKFKDFLEVIDDLETDRLYYEDPVLTFENSILTGCYLDMNQE